MLLTSLVLTLVIFCLLFKIRYDQNNINKKEFFLNLKLNDLTKNLDTTLQEYSNLNQNYHDFVIQSNIKDEKIDSFKKTIALLHSDIEKQKIQSSLLLKESVANARKDALKRSRAVIRGQASEHLAPYVVPNTNPKDYRFMGNPIDFICFEGLSDVLDGQSDAITSVRFVDIKTGKASLNKTQRRIRDAIKEGKVTFEIINLDNQLERQKNDTQSSKKCTP